MTVLKLVAIALIFCLATVGWMILGGSVLVRTNGTGERLEGEVGQLWGQAQFQQAPVFTWVASDAPKGVARVGELGVEGSDLSADFKLDQRRKGLLWYATYAVDFKGAYTVSNPRQHPVTGSMSFPFPQSDGVYDGFAVRVDGTEVPVTYKEGSAVADFSLAPGAKAKIETGYRTQGLDEWRYIPTANGVGVIKDFRLKMSTDFTQVDYAGDAVSPTSAKPAGKGMELTWAYESLVSGRPMALLMPKPANPGDVATRITFFAPVSLLFFFAALVLLTATGGVRLHPMHYAFLAAAFFAFHLLFAYLADRVDVNLTFAIASVASVALVLGYLRVVVGWNRALLEIALSQFVFLVLFSYSFFFEGLTGLAVTIGAVLTLAVFMAKTAKVDWEAAFRRPERPAPPAPPVAAT